MINADTFPALAEIWTEYCEEVSASQGRHMNRLDDILEQVSLDEMTQQEGMRRARRSRDVMEDRFGFLRRWYAQNLSDELAAWMEA